MALPEIDGTFRVALTWDNSDLLTNAVNVMHFRSTSLDAGDIYAVLDSHVNNVLWYGQDTHSAVGRVDVTPLDGSSATFSHLTGKPAKWSGSATAEDVNPQVASIVKLVTNRRGRSYRGRIYLPWVAESRVTNGRFDPADIASLNTAWLAFLNACASDAAHLVVASYKLSTAEDVTAILYETQTATQRRRLKRTST